MAPPQEVVETPSEESTNPEAKSTMRTSTPVPHTQHASNQQIFDLLLSMQKNQAALEKRLDQLEQGVSKGSPGFEVLSQKDWQPVAHDEAEEFIGAIDQGTTSSRFLIFDKKGEPVANHQIEFKQIYPNSG
jgi:glycerol kinase